MWISFCKKYLQYQGVLGIKITASTAVLYSTGIGMLNASFSRSLNMFWNQSWSTYKRITSINGTQLNKTDVYSPPPPKILVYLGWLKVFINAWLKLVVLLPDFSWSKYSGSNEKNNSQNFQNIFAFSSPMLLPQMYWLMAYALGSRVEEKCFFSKMPKFLWSNYLH